MTITVVLTDDQALVRRGFRLILETEPGLEDNATRVMILTTFERNDYVFQAPQLGASGVRLLAPLRPPSPDLDRLTQRALEVLP